MKRVQTFSPTENQLKVLAIILANKEKPLLANKQISNDDNLVGAKRVLMSIGAITASSTSIAVTSGGNKVAIDNNIVDDAGMLTDVGNQLSATTNTPATTTPAELDAGDMSMQDSDPLATDDEFSMESFSPLFKQLIL